MQISVNLQSNIFIPMILLCASVFAILIISIYILKSIGKFKTKKVPKVKELTLEEKNNIKHKYIKKIDNLKRKVNNEKIKAREAYQTLSAIIRHFVYEMTKIKVQNYTLEEIKRLDMQELYELVEEYYEPEFAVEAKRSDIRKFDRKNKKGN